MVSMTDFDKLGTPVDEMLEAYCKKEKEKPLYPDIKREMAIDIISDCRLTYTTEQLIERIGDKLEIYYRVGLKKGSSENLIDSVDSHLFNQLKIFETGSGIIF